MVSGCRGLKIFFSTSVCLSVRLSLPLAISKVKVVEWLGRGLKTLSLSAFGANQCLHRHRSLIQDSGQAVLG